MLNQPLYVWVCSENDEFYCSAKVDKVSDLMCTISLTDVYGQVVNIEPEACILSKEDTLRAVDEYLRNVNNTRTKANSFYSFEVIGYKKEAALLLEVSGTYTRAEHRGQRVWCNPSSTQLPYLFQTPDNFWHLGCRDFKYTTSSSKASKFPHEIHDWQT